jgi:hypothetical protein
VATAQTDFAAAEERLLESLPILRELGDRLGLCDSLEALAAVAAATSRPERGLRLAGSASKAREVLEAAPSRPDQEILERGLAEARRALPEQAARAAWESGRGLPLDAAADLALGGSERKTSAGG